MLLRVKMPNSLPKYLPYYFSGTVVPGFQRGSKELGCPTANLSDNVVNSLPEEFPSAVFYGLARVNGGEIHKMVMSVGWNPTYNNQRKTVEVHIIHNFEGDLYGQQIDAVVLGQLREMIAFKSIEELKEAIQKDISTAIEKISAMDDLSTLIGRYFISSEPRSHL